MVNPQPRPRQDTLAAWYEAIRMCGSRVQFAAWPDGFDDGRRRPLSSLISEPLREEVPSELAKLMAAAFKQIHTSGKAPEQMRNAVVTLLYKDKGQRENLKYYRPIAVANAVGKIFGMSHSRYASEETSGLPTGTLALSSCSACTPTAGSG